MYSVILMMAMSGAPAEAPAWPFRSNNCYGCTGWAGNTGHACYGSGYAWGGQHIACYGYSLNCVGFSCFGSYPTYFAGPVTPYHYIPAVPSKIREHIPGPKSSDRGQLTVPAPAELTVSLPADAKLFAEGQPTHLTTSERRFQTPPLPPGRDFHYTLRMEVVRNGQTVSVDRQIIVRAGTNTRVEFGDAADRSQSVSR